MAAPFAGTGIADAYGELKEWYETPEALHELMYKDHPFMRMLSKKPSGGKYVTVPMKIGGTAGNSGDFTQALQNQTPGNYQEFKVPMQEQVSLTTVQGIAIAAAKTKRGGFAELMKSEMDGAYVNFGRMMAKSLFGGGNGAFGTIASISTAGVIVFTNASDVTAWDIGYVIQDITASTGVPNASYGVVVAVSWASGSMVVSNVRNGTPGNPGTLSGGTAWAVGDLLTVAGNYNNVITGIQGWIPGANGSTRPVTGGSAANNNLFTVDRSQNDVALAGVPFDGSRSQVEDVLYQFINNAIMVGEADPDFVVMGYQSYNAVISSLQGKHFYINGEDEAGIGFRIPAIEGPKGEVGIIQDRDCPAYTAYAIDSSAIYIATMENELPAVAEEDGLPWLRIGTANSYQTRLVGYYNLICSMPMHMSVAKLPN